MCPLVLDSNVGTYHQGVISVKRTDLDCLYVFIKPPSLEELVSQLSFHHPQVTERSLSLTTRNIKF